LTFITEAKKLLSVFKMDKMATGGRLPIYLLRNSLECPKDEGRGSILFFDFVD